MFTSILLTALSFKAIGWGMNRRLVYRLLVVAIAFSSSSSVQAERKDAVYRDQWVAVGCVVALAAGAWFAAPHLSKWWNGSEESPNSNTKQRPESGTSRPAAQSLLEAEASSLTSNDLKVLKSQWFKESQTFQGYLNKLLTHLKFSDKAKKAVTKEALDLMIASELDPETYRSSAQLVADKFAFYVIDIASTDEDIAKDLSSTGKALKDGIWSSIASLFANDAEEEDLARVRDRATLTGVQKSTQALKGFAYKKWVRTKAALLLKAEKATTGLVR